MGVLDNKNSSSFGLYHQIEADFSLLLTFITDLSSILVNMYQVSQDLIPFKSLVQGFGLTLTLEFSSQFIPRPQYF